MKIAIGSDHAGYLLKETLKKHLMDKGLEVQDFGTHSEERADYPDFGHAVAESVRNKENEFGILICGSGVGISIAANKHEDIRAALCWNEEVASLARQHNDANIIALPARFMSADLAIKCVDIFLNTTFEGGRHLDRVKKIKLKV